MANIKSQIKRIKTNEKARQRNKATKSALKTSIRRFREAVQGVYFAGRIAADVLTGVADGTENAQGLDDARRRLSELG